MGLTTFIRRAKKQDNFTVLDCTVIRMTDISWKAKGLHTYLMQLPGDWKISIQDLCKRSKDGKDSTMAALKELKEAGLFEMEVKRVKGRFSEVNYIVYENPTVCGKTAHGEPENGFPENGFPATTNNESSTNDEDLTNNEGNKTPNGEPKDFFIKVEGLKDKIGAAQYKLLNEVCTDEGIYLTLKGLFPDGRCDLLMDWLEYKKARKQPYKTSTGIAGKVKQFSDYTTREMRIALENAVSNETQGIFPRRISESKPQVDTHGIGVRLAQKMGR